MILKNDFTIREVPALQTLLKLALTAFTQLSSGRKTRAAEENSSRGAGLQPRSLPQFTGAEAGVLCLTTSISPELSSPAPPAFCGSLSLNRACPCSLGKGSVARLA